MLPQHHLELTCDLTLNASCDIALAFAAGRPMAAGVFGHRLCLRMGMTNMLDIMKPCVLDGDDYLSTEEHSAYPISAMLTELTASISQDYITGL
jgi:hypothetical protein